MHLASTFIESVTTMKKSNLVMFSATPRQIKHSYRQTSIVLSFIPETTEWEWSITFTTTSNFTGKAKTQHHALKKAKEKVDMLRGDI